ncbi:hypothetical protein FA13DRAFT_1739187 [Coprinellus micaceus]|uniref:Bacterial surface antigen (D15) domain-containing protein n=1 Tax=Coprinellus micaceus TaxID=71717 RepID=A0A4Y7SRZ2_COPMI|nr:hypothetical protein FA13DRAFT_1739187 [Coprinellus micaceus]
MSVQEEALSQKDHTEEEPRAKEWEKVQKWQEARIERRLRGEYESAVLHLQEVFSIANLRVENAKSTRKSFLGFLLDPILSSTPQTKAISNPGSSPPCPPKLNVSPDPSLLPTPVDVILKTKERGRYGNNEGSANASATIRNTLNVNVALGTKTRRSGGATLSAPLTRDLETFGSLNVYGLERDLTALCELYASVYVFALGEFAVCLTVALGKLSQAEKAFHEMGYEAGRPFKSSIFHSFIYDTRDDKLAATQGAYAKLYHEFAGLGGDAHFYKAEAEAQGSESGWGRTMEPDSVGGDIYYSLGASVISKVPKKPHWPVNLHGWVNAGRVPRPLVDNVKDVPFKTPQYPQAWAYIYRFDPVRVEVNFGVPIVSSKSDGTRKGIQVGVGVGVPLDSCEDVEVGYWRFRGGCST